ncbi:MAG: protein translocase subunit SecF [Patescibacteria group bacterium]
MIHFIEYRKWWYGLSGLLLTISLVYLAFGGLKLGIDFTGGSLLQVTFPLTRPTTDAAELTLADLELGDVLAQPIGDRDMIFRVRELTNVEKNKMVQTLQMTHGVVQEVSFESIGPTIGAELRQKAVWSVVLVLVAIILYISWAFRRVSAGPVPSWVFGSAAILALIHDITIVSGLFAILGTYFHVEVDALFVSAILTILGFSVHDTIVVFDRIRERLKHQGGRGFIEVINESINQTMIRSLNTSLTTLLVLLTLYLFGGDSIQWFVLALIVGIVIGTYSSIFIASPLLLLGQRFKNR